jgi:hypothetical protein
VRSRTRSPATRRKRSLSSSELEEYTKDFVAKVVAELQEHGELLTVTYLLLGDDFVLVPTFYRTSLEKQVATVAIDALIARLGPRAVFYVTRGWVIADKPVVAAVELQGFGDCPELVAYGPDDPLPAERRDAFCVLARTESHELVAVTPYTIDPRPDGRTVACREPVSWRLV